MRIKIKQNEKIGLTSENEIFSFSDLTITKPAIGSNKIRKVNCSTLNNNLSCWTRSSEKVCTNLSDVNSELFVKKTSLMKSYDNNWSRKTKLEIVSLISK